MEDFSYNDPIGYIRRQRASLFLSQDPFNATQRVMDALRIEDPDSQLAAVKSLFRSFGSADGLWQYKNSLALRRKVIVSRFLRTRRNMQPWGRLNGCATSVWTKTPFDKFSWMVAVLVCCLQCGLRLCVELLFDEMSSLPQWPRDAGLLVNCNCNKECQITSAFSALCLACRHGVPVNVFEMLFSVGEIRNFDWVGDGILPRYWC
jgi:hypothetical protein